VALKGETPEADGCSESVLGKPVTNLTVRQLVDLNRHLIGYARFMDRPEERTSRQIEGEMHLGGGETLASSSVLVYIERGLGDHAAELQPIFQRIFKIYAKSPTRHWLGFFTFGWEDSQLHQGEHLCRGESAPTADAFVNALCELAGTELGPTPATVPSLSSLATPQTLAHSVDENDLLVFVCKDKHTPLGKTARSEYSAALIRNAIWVFLDGGHSLELEYRPGEAGASD